jgi:glycosyltransferase involved in cell wall biosynthesis
VVAGAKGKPSVFEAQSLEPLPPRVHLTGHVVDELLPPLYSGAIGSVYLSLYEGFGLPPLESMACGTPVIASNAASIPEVVGGAGLAIDPLDTDAIADAFVRLTYDTRLRNVLRTSGLARAKLFDWRRTAENTMSILKQACRS